MSSFAGFGSLGSGKLASALTTHFVRQGPAGGQGHPLSPETFNTHRIQAATANYKANYKAYKKVKRPKKGPKSAIKGFPIPTGQTSLQP